MKKIKLINLLLLLVLISSCSKKSNNLNNSKNANSLITEFYRSTEKVDGSLYLINDMLFTSNNNSAPLFSFQAKFPDGSSYNKLTVNTFDVDISNNSAYAASNQNNPNLTSNDLNKYFGASNGLKIDNKDFVKDFYVPSPVKIEFPSQNLVFDKTKNIELNITDDPNNQNQIIAVLEYVPDNAEAGAILLTKSFILDAGQTKLTITSADLKEFPINQKLILYVANGSYGIHQFENKSYDVEGINISYVPGIQLQ